jgi:phospholipid transport system transporter-binding protein
MQAELKQQTHSLVLKVTGDLDQLTLTKDYWLTTSKMDKLTLVENANLFVCLKNVQRADSAGLAWLINLKRDLKQHKVNVSIQHPPKKLVELAKLSNAASFLE